MHGSPFRCWRIIIRSIPQKQHGPRPAWVGGILVAEFDDIKPKVGSMSVEDLRQQPQRAGMGLYPSCKKRIHLLLLESTVGSPINRFEIHTDEWMMKFAKASSRYLSGCDLCFIFWSEQLYVGVAFAIGAAFQVLYIMDFVLLTDLKIL